MRKRKTLTREEAHAKKQKERANKARKFPVNTCPASRHAQLIGETLAKGKRYPMLEEEPAHCAGSILSTVASLYEARTEIARLAKELERAKR